MALTLATVDDFVEMKDINKTGVISVSALTSGYDKIESYLRRATRYIERMTRREFFPYYAQKSYPIPHQFTDLRMHRYPTAHIKLHDDLLEVTEFLFETTEIPNGEYYLMESNLYPKTTAVIRLPSSIGLTSIASTRRFDEPVIHITGVWGYSDYVRYPHDAWLDTNETVPIGGLTSDATSFVASDTDSYDENFRKRFVKGRLLKINNEFIEVTDVNNTSNTVTIKRGARGSVANLHSEGDIIYSWQVTQDIVEATLQIAKTWRESDIAAGSRLGVSDYSAGVEVNIPADPARIVKSYERSVLG